MSRPLRHPMLEWFDSNADPRILAQIIHRAGITRQRVVEWAVMLAGGAEPNAGMLSDGMTQEILLRDALGVHRTKAPEARRRKMRSLGKTWKHHREDMLVIARWACIFATKQGPGFNTRPAVLDRWDAHDLFRAAHGHAIERGPNEWIMAKYPPDPRSISAETYIAITQAVLTATSALLRASFPWTSLVESRTQVAPADDWSVLPLILDILEPNRRRHEHRTRIAQVLDDRPSGPSPAFARTVRQTVEKLVIEDRWIEAPGVLDAAFSQAIERAIAGRAA